MQIDLPKSIACIEPKVVLVGDSGVGKTSLISALSDYQFFPYTVSTIGVDIKTIELRVEDNKLALKIWDTAGAERFRSITKTFLNNAKGVLVVFDLTDLKSFKSLEYWINDVRKILGNDIPLIIVGNKSDLNDDRRVNLEEIQEFVDLVDSTYVETSAKNISSVREAFLKLAKIMLTKKIYNASSIKQKKSIKGSFYLNETEYSHIPSSISFKKSVNNRCCHC